jgi:uncharacterized protein (TIGR03663 family)
MNRWATAGVLLAVGIALAFRCPRLTERPMHNDEAVNAVKFGELWEHGSYKYDPEEYHGPSLPYASLILNRLTRGPDYKSFNETRLRMVTVLFGAGLILVLPLLSDGLGRKAVIWAAVLIAVSPAMVFYSRYYIHEMLLVFFATLALASGWRYWRSRKPGWALLCGGSIGLMHATKETFVITLVAAGLALILNQLWNRWLDATGVPIRAPRLDWRHLAAGLGLWVVIGVVLLSSFFTNASGPWDSVKGYSHWLGRAGGNSAHTHAWSFYFHRLLFFHVDKGPVWSEGLILVLGLIGIAAGFTRKWLDGASASFVRFLGIYTLLLAAFYSLISYKTPWCLLNFWLGFILLAGVGATVLVRITRTQWARVAMTIVLAAGVSQLGAQAWEASFRYSTDGRNPYVYAHTSADVFNLVQKVESLAAASPQGHKTLVMVMAPENEYWPLPWYLRRFDQIGYFGQVPDAPFAPIMIVSAQLHARLDEKKTHVMVGYSELRPQVFFELYVELELWKHYLARSAPK